MHINDRQAEQLRRQPINAAKHERERHHPKPITIRLLLSAHQHQRADPEDHQRVPNRDRVGPIRARPDIRVIKRRQRNIHQREQPDSRECDDKEIARAAKARRQTHNEITSFEPIVRTREKEDRNDRHLQWEPTCECCR